MKIISKNKKAKHNFEIIKKYNAGISLLGSEVKSIRDNPPSLIQSFINIKDRELFLINLNITKYSFSSPYFSHEPLRNRKLLLNKSEIRRIIQDQKEQRYILIPLTLYWTSNSLIKLEFAAAKPLKKYDKREKEKEKTIQRNKW